MHMIKRECKRLIAEASFRTNVKNTNANQQLTTEKEVIVTN